MDDYISVIVTAYSRKQFLMDALKSTVNQTLNGKNYEIILIKNFSDDSIDRYAGENNIKNIVMDGTVGEFLNTGITESHGNIISFLDDDDWIAKEKLECVFNTFNVDENIVYLHNNYENVDKNGNTFTNHKKLGDGFNMSCISIRKHAINNNIAKVSELTDTFMYFSALEAGKLAASEKVLTFYRHHNKNASITHNHQDRMRFVKREIEEYRKFYNFFNTRRVKNSLRARITNECINLYVNGEDVEINGIINYILNSNYTFVHRIKTVASMELQRFGLRKKLIGRKKR